MYDFIFIVGFLFALFYAISNAEGTIMQIYHSAKPDYSLEIYKFVKQEIGGYGLRELSAFGWMKD